MLLKLLNGTTLIILLLATIIGCKKLDLVLTDRFTELTFWKSDENVSNSLNNVYNRLYNSQFFFYNEALSDNAYTRLGISAGFPEVIASGSYTSTLARFQNEWSYFYTGIKAANLFLENVDTAKRM